MLYDRASLVQETYLPLVAEGEVSLHPHHFLAQHFLTSLQQYPIMFNHLQPLHNDHQNTNDSHTNRYWLLTNCIGKNYIYLGVHVSVLWSSSPEVAVRGASLTQSLLTGYSLLLVGDTNIVM